MNKKIFACINYAIFFGDMTLLSNPLLGFFSSETECDKNLLILPFLPRFMNSIRECYQIISAVFTLKSSKFYPPTGLVFLAALTKNTIVGDMKLHKILKPKWAIRLKGTLKFSSRLRFSRRDLRMKKNREFS